MKNYVLKGSAREQRAGKAEFLPVVHPDAADVEVLYTGALSILVVQ